MITHTWVPNGLKHVRGRGNSFLYKKVWVDEYIESQIIQSENSFESKEIKPRFNKCKRNIKFVV